jgi:hypothetical protein
MSEYIDKHSLFLEPRTKQYGSHMVMTNVQKPMKTKYINIDTRFRDEYTTLQTTNYNITMPERTTDVHSIRVCNIELPNAYYNLSDNLRNNRLRIVSGSNVEEIVVPDGQYTAASLQAELNAKFQASAYGQNLTITLGATNKSSVSLSSGDALTLNFSSDSSVCSEVSDKYNVKMSLGWQLGFRTLTQEITVAASPVSSYAPLDLHGPRYLYLAVEEYGKGNPNSFQSPMPSSQINKNILARITLDPTQYPYGSTLPANTYNGFLLSDVRSYSGKVDLQRLNVQILNEVGVPMALNGAEFSFCLEVAHE